MKAKNRVGNYNHKCVGYKVIDHYHSETGIYETSIVPCVNLIPFHVRQCYKCVDLEYQIRKRTELIVSKVPTIFESAQALQEHLIKIAKQGSDLNAYTS